MAEQMGPLSMMVHEELPCALTGVSFVPCSWRGGAGILQWRERLFVQHAWSAACSLHMQLVLGQEVKT